MCAIFLDCQAYPQASIFLPRPKFTSGVEKMTEAKLHEWGTLILRIGLGVIYVAHSLYLKLLVFGLEGTAQFFQSIGLPSPLAYGVFTVEAVGGVALILGFRTRWAAAALLPVALGATWAHLGAGWLFSSPGGGWEYPLFLTIATLVQFLLGDGAYAIRRSIAVSGRVPRAGQV
jgi:putative oxidoreductase